MCHLAKIALIFLLAVLALSPLSSVYADDIPSADTTSEISDGYATYTTSGILEPMKQDINKANQNLSSGTPLPEAGEDTSGLIYVFGGNCADNSEILLKYADNCWMCVIFEKIFDAINELSYGVWEGARFEFVTLAALFVALWLAYHLLGHLASMTPQSPEEFWTKVSHVLFKLMFVCVIFLTPNSLGNFIGNWIISPVVIGASEFTSAITKSFTGISSAFSQERGAELQQRLYELQKDKTANPDSFKLASAGDDHTILDKDGNIVANSGSSYLNRDQLNELRTELKILKGYDCDDVRGTSAISLLSQYMKCAPLSAEKNAINKERIKEIENALTLSMITSNSPGEYINSCSNDLRVKADIITKNAKQYGNKAVLYGALTPETKGALMCMIESLNQETAFGIAMGEAIQCYSDHAWILRLGIWGSYALPHFLIWLTGTMIWIGCFVLGLIFFAKLVDACIRLGVFCALMPILLVAYIFPSTAMFAKNAFKILIQVVVSFIVLGIILSLAMLLLMQAFQVDTNFATPSGDAYDIRTLFYLNRVDLIAEHLGLTGKAFLTAIACLLFGVLITNQTDSIAAQFSGVSDALARGAGFGNAVGNSITNLAKMGANLGRAGAVGLGKAGIKGVGKLKDVKGGGDKGGDKGGGDKGGGDKK